jgi:hypothetical protein
VVEAVPQAIPLALTGRPASCVTRTDFGRRAPSAVRSVNNAILRNIATAYFIVPAERNDPDRDPSDEG